eukprot:1409233-Prymnesium_polylepis.1
MIFRTSPCWACPSSPPTAAAATPGSDAATKSQVNWQTRLCTAVALTACPDPIVLRRRAVPCRAHSRPYPTVVRQRAVPILLKGFGSTDLAHRLAARAKEREGVRATAADSALAQLELPEASVPWALRSGVAAWRGSARSIVLSETCVTVPLARWADHPRGRLVALSERHPQQVDAGYSELEKLPGGNESAVRTVGGLSWADMGKRKFLIEVDGHGYQASLAAKMMLRSAVLTQASGWRLWYEALLRDGVHVVRVAPNLSNLLERLAWLRCDDARARAIGERGARWIRRLLAENSLVHYVTLILRRYRTLFAPRAGAPPSLDALFGVLCAGRTCKHYTAAAPPQQFPKKAERAAKSDSLSSDAVIASCPTAHRGDGSVRECQRWCRAEDRRDHCTWCRCATCAFCAAGGAARTSKG